MQYQVLANEPKKLSELEIVEKTMPINKAKKSKCFYQIADPLIRFYFAFPIADVRSIGFL